MSQLGFAVTSAAVSPPVVIFTESQLLALKKTNIGPTACPHLLADLARRFLGDSSRWKEMPRLIRRAWGEEPVQ